VTPCLQGVSVCGPVRRDRDELSDRRTFSPTMQLDSAQIGAAEASRALPRSIAQLAARHTLPRVLEVVEETARTAISPGRA
jgi:hypothetical protein